MLSEYDFVIVYINDMISGGHTTLSSRRPSLESASGLGSGVGSDKEKEDTDIQDGRLAVFIYKRQDQSSHEVIQPLLRLAVIVYIYIYIYIYIYTYIYIYIYIYI